MTPVLLAAVASLLATCSISVWSEAAPGNPDEEAIKEVIAQTTTAFNKHDAVAFARLYTSDADLVSVRGEWMKGTSGIEQGLARVFATRAKHATLKPLEVHVTVIRPEVAVAHVTNELSGLEDLEGNTLPPHRELSIRVFVKDGGVWRVRAFHNTIAPPATYEPTSDALERRDLPVTPEDLRILERADAILADKGRWDRKDDRVCSAGDTTWSLFCALERASVEVLGTYDHRRAALQEVRFAIEAAAPGRRFEHRLQGYNNLDTTTFDDVKAVLRVARQRVAERLQSR
jgi:uncharacterized protein (TIGR02246 family)